jgi:hypothetical protein
MSVDKRGIQQSTQVTRTRADPANLCATNLATNFGRFEGIASAMESGVCKTEQQQRAIPPFVSLRFVVWSCAACRLELRE